MSEYYNRDYIDNNIVERYIQKFNSINSRLNSDEIHNIALMGENGSGKSTILRELIEQKPEKYISINMMEFNYNGAKMNSKKRSVIEKNIVDQLIHQVPSNEIPYSTLKKDYPNKDKIKEKILLFVLLVLSFIWGITWILIYSNKYDLWANKIEDIWDFVFFILSIIVVASVSIYFSYFFIMWFFKIYKRNRLSKLNLFKGIVDVQFNVYNTYIDELIYFFSSTKFDTVIFEDIDRYNDLLLFSHLRELNILLNSSSVLKNKKITFIYALRESLFKDKNKHKFFDEIIHVVPIVDYTNSIHKLKNYFGSENLSENTFRILSKYVCDLRTIKNIRNDYFDFLNLNSNDIYDKNNLLSIVFLKNIFPNEFKRLQYNKSIIDEIFKIKNEIIDEHISSKKEKIKDLNFILKDNNYLIEPKYSILGLIKKIIEENIDFESMKYPFKILELNLILKNINDIFDILVDTNIFSKLKSITIETIFSTRRIPLNVHLIKQIKYLCKLEEAKIKFEIKSDREGKLEIKKLEKDIEKLIRDGSKFYRLSNEEVKKISLFLDENKVNKHFSKFIKDLFFNNLIDEQYTQLISYDYNNKYSYNRYLTDNDRIFIENYKEGIRNHFDLKIQKVDLIYKEIGDDLFVNPLCFNYYVLEFAIYNKTEKIEEILLNNKNNFKALYYSYCFLINFPKNIIELMLKINKDSILELIANDPSNEISNFRSNMWISSILLLNNKIFKSLDTKLLDYKFSNFNFVNIYRLNKHEIDNMILNLKCKQIKFNNIEIIKDKKELLEPIINNFCFMPNFCNLKLISNDLNYADFCENSSLKKYIQEYIRSFLNVLIENKIKTKQPLEFEKYIKNKLKDDNIINEYYEMLRQD